MRLFRLADPETGEPGKRLPMKVTICGFCRGHGGISVECTRCNNTGRSQEIDLKKCSRADVQTYNAQRGRGVKFCRRRRDRRGEAVQP